MAICPFAVQKIIPKWNTRRMAVYKRVNLHQAVSNAASLYPYFSGTNLACSHFWISETGVIEQYIDTRYQSASDRDGNDATISVETWDKGGQVEYWNSAQLAALVNLIRWIWEVHPSIPKKLASNSVAAGDTSKGISWHRLGVESRPPHQPGYRVPGGMFYSKAVGKSCPGNGRIGQIPNIARLAEVLDIYDPEPSVPAIPIPEVKREVVEEMLIRCDEKGSSKFGAVIHIVGSRAVRVLGGSSTYEGRNDYVDLSAILPTAQVREGQFREYEKLLVREDIEGLQKKDL